MFNHASRVRIQPEEHSEYVYLITNTDLFFSYKSKSPFSSSWFDPTKQLFGFSSVWKDQARGWKDQARGWKDQARGWFGFSSVWKDQAKGRKDQANSWFAFSIVWNDQARGWKAQAKRWFGHSNELFLIKKLSFCQYITMFINKIYNNFQIKKLRSSSQLNLL